MNSGNRILGGLTALKDITDADPLAALELSRPHQPVDVLARPRPFGGAGARPGRARIRDRRGNRRGQGSESLRRSVGLGCAFALRLDVAGALHQALSRSRLE